MPHSFALTGLDETLSQLLQETQTDALACIHRVQLSVADALRRQGQGERLSRLSHADIVESLLVKASRVIAQDASYSQLTHKPLQENFLEAHLRVALLGWLESHVRGTPELKALQGARRVLYQL